MATLALMRQLLERGPAPAVGSPYRAFGVAGIIAAFVTLLALPAGEGALALDLVLTVSALATFVAASLVRRRLLGRERHVLLEDVLLVLGSGALAARALGVPVAATLDRLMVALGVFLVFGRVGCFASGCCYGRPARIGVCYHASQVPCVLAGVRLFPVPLVEAAWIVVVTAAAVGYRLSAAPAGTAVWWWLLAYGAGRFGLEFIRGDRRPRLGPLSESQWLVLGLLAARAASDEWHHLSLTRVSVLASALFGVAVAYRLRRLWLAPAPFDGARAAAWQRFLASLDHLADGSLRIVHGEAVAVGLTVDPADDGNLWCYSLRGTFKADELAWMVGLIRQRLARHHLLRLRANPSGNIDLWLLVTGSRPGSTLNDDPELVLLRALSFSAEATSS